MTIGLDRSLNLLEIAKGVGEVVRGDAMQCCWRPGIFVSWERLENGAFIEEYSLQDYAISIATIHHLTTHERRMRAVQVRMEPLQVYLHLTPQRAIGTLTIRQPRRWKSHDLCLVYRARFTI